MSNLVPAAQRDTILQLVREADEVLGAFLRGQLLVYDLFGDYLYDWS